MPPIEEEKNYCRRYECPLPGNVTIETFYNGMRQQAIICSYNDATAYVAILVQNGYVYTAIEDTEDFVR